ncbi:UPF0235 protein [Candidatus Protochlamydia amoebophila]|uniref:UPF0235 protein PC_RS02435 n=2 Tax=Candidatus Protochlamydia amoebophila TaxID=362787 RepID=Q6MDX5_PARUW|nr:MULTISPECIES: DUF167 domain-containing protein [Protochlamydia]KIC73443.1 hypothetical protein DB44_BG01330 [Candidatus Protochlamydia amoebophila]MBS4163746.1 UPF0235 protein [Candidatus Protochlamydia amoebophila]CAF23224.1 unnamed protein product [Candidatus Protochlamydia amoebophila UWE25]
MFQQTNRGIIIKIKVIPLASFSEKVGWEGDELKIRLAAIPDKGQANTELIRFLSSLFKIRKSSIQLIQGQTSRHKKICIQDISLERLQVLLA